MNNNITALAQREKFEAWWEENYHNGNPPRFGWAYWREVGGYKIEDDEPELDGMWNAWQAASVKLVEALEAEQQKSAKQGRHACELFDEVKQLQEQLRTVELSNSVLESRIVTVELPAMNDDLIAILGRPNFMCAHLAELLRKSGEDIKRKSEHEQAAIIHWFLGLYLEHGDKWESVAKSDIQARVAGIQVIEGEG